MTITMMMMMSTYLLCLPALMCCRFCRSSRRFELLLVRTFLSELLSERPGERLVARRMLLLTTEPPDRGRGHGHGHGYHHHPHHEEDEEEDEEEEDGRAGAVVRPAVSVSVSVSASLLLLLLLAGLAYGTVALGSEVMAAALPLWGAVLALALAEQFLLVDPLVVSFWTALHSATAEKLSAAVEQLAGKSGVILRRYGSTVGLSDSRPLVVMMC